MRNMKICEYQIEEVICGKYARMAHMKQTES